MPVANTQAFFRRGEPFIRRPIATSPLMAALAFIGIVSFPLLMVTSLPNVDFPTIPVGASSEVMSSSAAGSLERQFGQMPGLTQILWKSTPDANRNIDRQCSDGAPPPPHQCPSLGRGEFR